MLRHSLILFAEIFFLSFAVLVPASSDVAQSRTTEAKETQILNGAVFNPTKDEGCANTWISHCENI